MGKMSDGSKTVLPEFQAFLLKQKFVPEKNAPYFAYWVSRYLGFARRKNINAATYQENVALECIEELRSNPGLRDWQPRQAEDALFRYAG
jgi:hypothetical protein